MPMAHKQFEYLLPDFAGGTLDQSSSELLSAHLEHCTVCSQRLETFRQVMTEVRIARDADRVPEGYFTNILPRFRARLSERGSPSFGFRWFQLGAPFAATVVVAGLLATLQLPLEPGASKGLRSLAEELEATELTDALFSEIDQQSLASMNADDALVGTIAREAVSRELLERITESSWGDVVPLRTLDDLESDELDILLQRLESRKYL